MEIEQPVSTLAEAISINPQSVASLMLLGHSFYSQGKMAEARDVFEGIVLLDSSNPYAHASLGCIHQQHNQYQEAVECFSHALRLYSADINTLTNRGECYLHLGRLEESAQDFKAAILLDVEENNQAANRARFLAKVTLEALKLAHEQGTQAIAEAKRRLDEQLQNS